jgi:uncharacterized coiled-coil DUF342 family protein
MDGVSRDVRNEIGRVCQEITDLKQQMKTGTTQTDKAKLQKEIDDRQAAITEVEDALAEMKRKSRSGW